MDAKLSVIVPVYNAEEFLEECILHIVNQTYKNLEILLVNDGSTDKSVEIINEYCRKDSRIRCINQKNSGVSSARNAGIDAASGEYITFVDSDDYPELEMCERLMTLIKKYAVSMAVCSFHRCKERSNKNVFDKKISNVDVFYEMAVLGQIESYPWGKIYKRDLFDGIKYPEGKVYEDVFITFKLIEKAKYVAFTNAEMYFYRINKNSITRSNYKKHDIDLVYSSEEFLEFLEKKQYKKAALKQRDAVTRNAIAIIRKMFSANQYYEDQIRYCHEIICKGYPQYLKSQFKISSKLFGIAVMVSPKGLFYFWKKRG